MENSGQKAFNFNSTDLLIYIWKKRLPLIIVGFVAGITSILISFTITPMFQSSVVMFPSSSASVSKDLLSQNYSGRQSVHSFGEEEEAEQLLQILNSEPVRSRIIQKYELMSHYEIEPDSRYPMTQLYEQYRSNINFRLTEYMSVEIAVMDRDPVYAANIANDISDLVDTVFNDMKKERAREAYRLVEKEYREAAANLALLQDSLKKVTGEASSVSRNDDANEALVKLLSENGVLYMSMMNQIRYEAGMVAELSLKHKEARLEMEQNLPHKFVVEKAYPSEKKAYPKKSLIVMVSTFSALLLTLIMLILIDNIQNRTASTRKE